MKQKARFLAFAALLSALCSCASIQPDPPPQPPPAGSYVVYRLSDTGKRVESWEVTTYRYTMFPRAVEFTDASGQPVKLTRSFEIVQKP